MSKEIFEKNLKAMEEWYPAFAEAIRSQKYKKDELKLYEERSWDGELIYRVEKGEKLLYLNGRRNAGNPLDTWVEHLGEIHDYAPVFLLGLGSGLYLKKLIHATNEKINVIVYEPSLTIFIHTLEEIDLSEEIAGRPIAFVVEGLNGNELAPVVEKLVSLETMEFLKQEVHPNYQQLFPEKIVEVLRVIHKRVWDIITNSNTGALFAAYMARNQMKNMKYVCDGYNTLQLSKVVPYDGAAILVAAGPSLDKNIAELKKAKNKAFILAVDTAIKPLIKAGVVPDAFITIDPKKALNLVDIEGVKDIPLVTPVTANCEILENQRGKKIFYYDGYLLPMLAYLTVGKTLRAVSTGGSVACSGLSLLYKMGFDTIILVGQDLAYTDNKPYANGTFRDVMPTRDTSGMIRVKGNYEDTVPTIKNLKIYLDWFGNYVEGMKKHRNVRVINATEGGAYIEHTELMTLKDAIAENCSGREVDFEACIARMESEFTPEQRKQVVEYLHTLPAELGKIQVDAKKLYTAYHKIYNISKSGKLDKNAYLELLKKVKKYGSSCEHNQMYQLIAATMPVAEMIVKSESLYQLDSVEEEAQAIGKQGMNYSKMLQECAKILKEFAEETLLPIE